MLLTIYHKLYTAYGQRGWWPLVSIKTRTAQQGTTAASRPTVLSERANSMGETATVQYHQRITCPNHRFEIAVGAILTQNTAWTNVEKALMRLHENKLLTPQKIIATPHNKLAQIIRSAGYFNQKAERLKILAAFFLTTDITKEELQILRTKLLALKGIGPETADSIILYAAEKPIFVIDAYTRRIFSRLGFWGETGSYGEWQEFFHTNLFSILHKPLPMNKLPASTPRIPPYTPGHLPQTTNHKPQTTHHRPQTTDLRLQTSDFFKEYHALLVEHAKQHCKKKPLCNQCPLEKGCKKKRV